MPIRVDLVGVGGPDAATSRPDLQLAEPALLRAVERDVPGHDQVRVARDEDEARRCPAAGLELVQLGDQDVGVDDAARADRTLLALDDPGRDLPDLVGLVADDDRVTGVRAALVAADEVRLGGEQVDDLALALVSPLRADDHGRRHVPQSGTSARRRLALRRCQESQHLRREQLRARVHRGMSLARHDHDAAVRQRRLQRRAG